MTLFGNRVAVAAINQVKTRPVGWALIPMTGVCVSRGYRNT